ncbi:MAG: 1,4-dihydroxy-6-naphthoate synthase, partial [Myxococcales bacterium]|nr:1,4-dihydroxy-6-naphthoate synthase [Myxococcales bacterium]
NDTFMFHELVRGGAPVPGVEWDLELLDIEALNRAALLGPGRFDVTKLSIPALAAAVEHYTALGSGAALGRGCGPLVVRRSDRPELKNLRDLDGLRVAIPGEHTTANLLLRIFGPANLRPVPLRFDAILTAIAEGEVDAGAIIHESRFTFADHGLTEISDLGSVWEDA